VPDPQAVETFEASKLVRGAPDPFYGELLQLRRELPRELLVDADGTRLTMRRGGVELIADFAAQTVELRR
jgi:hypothetical protein